MRIFTSMDRRLSRSMPVFPLSYVSIKNPDNIGRGRTQHRRYWVNGVGPTRLVGLSPSHRPPQRLILCTPHGSYEKVTRSSSYAELSHSGVYRSREDMRDARAERRAASYEDMYRGTVSTCWGDSSRFSESGVSVNCSHTDDGSFMGVEEDAASQSSFGSSSAFHEMTCDSELDRPDSDCVSVPGSERSRSARAERERSLPGTQIQSGLHATSKTHRAASSHNGEWDASSVKSGEFFHSTPTKKGALSLSIFPADDDLQLTGKDFPSSSQPPSPRNQHKAGDKHKTNKSPVHSPKDSLRECVKRSREQFFSSLQDCSKLDDLSAGDSIQAWVSTGHRPTGVSNWVNDLSSSLQRQMQHGQDQKHADTKTSSPSLGTGASVSVSERVKALETGRGSGDADDVCTKKTDAANNPALPEPGTAVFSSRLLRQPPAPHSASQIGPSLAGGGGYEIGNFGFETHVTGTAVSSKVSQGEGKKNKAGTVDTTTANNADTTTANNADTTEGSAEIADQWRRICGANEQDSGVIPRSRVGLSGVVNTGVATAGVKYSAAKQTELTSDGLSGVVNTGVKHSAAKQTELTSDGLSGVVNTGVKHSAAKQTELTSDGLSGVVNTGVATAGVKHSAAKQNELTSDGLSGVVNTGVDTAGVKHSAVKQNELTSDGLSSFVNTGVATAGVKHSTAKQTELTSDGLSGVVNTGVATAAVKHSTAKQTELTSDGLSGVVNTGVATAAVKHSTAKQTELTSDGLSGSVVDTGVGTAGVKHSVAKQTELTSDECVADRESPAASNRVTFNRAALFTTDPQTDIRVACQGEGACGAREEGVAERELYDTVASPQQSRELCDTVPSTQQSRELCYTVPSTQQSRELCYTVPSTQQSRELSDTVPSTQQSKELCDLRPNQQAAQTDENPATAPHSSAYDENNSICDTESPPPLPSTPPPTLPSAIHPLELEFHQQIVTPPSVLSVNMSRQRNENFAPQEDGAWWSCSTDPGARYVDGSEEQDPDVRIREISRTHTRHIHRTTVQQVVTTHRTPRPGEDTIQRLPNSYANGVSEADSGDVVTDRIVSTVLEDSDREETTRYSTTQQHLAYSHRAPGRGDGGRGIASPDTHGSPLPAAHAVSATAQRQLTQHHDQLQQQHSVTVTTTGASMQSSPNRSLLDSLQEQLSRLSSDDVTFDGSVSNDRYSKQVCGYRDHAEASLPHYDTEQSGTVSHGDIDGKSRVCGTGSVFITLDKSGQESSAYIQHSIASPASEESDSRHKCRESLSSDGGEARDRGRGGSTPPTQHVGKVLWRPPASSSSELDDSDGNYSSISTTESSQYPHTHTDSDYLASEGPEDYDNVNSFTDFVSGLKGQSTSDQPSSRHVHYDMASLLRSPFIQETILEADDESESADEANTTLSTTLNSSLNSFKTSLHFSVQAQSTPTAPTPSNVPQIRLWSSDQRITTLSPSGGDVTSSLSPVHPLQELSELLCSISSLHDTSDRMSSINDASFEVEHHLSRTLDSHMSHTLDSQHLDELDASLARMSSCSSPVPSDVSEGSVYSCVGFAEVKKSADLTSSADRSGASKAKSSVSSVRRNLASTFKSMKESDWVMEKQVLFERLLSDLERQSRPQTRVMFDELCHLENQQRGGDAKDPCDDWYRAFTRDDLEKRQNHICPIIDDNIMPVFRFKRFLKKNHSSKMKGKSQFRIVNKLDRLAESPPDGVTSLTETDIASRLRQKPYERGVKLSHRLPSDVFTDDGDVKKSFSDSAYSTMSSVSSRHWSDFDSVTSVSSSRGDVSSVTADSSMDGDKLSAMSDVFEQLDVCKGEIDQALLDRLRAGHHSVSPFHLDTRRHRYSHH